MLYRFGHLSATWLVACTSEGLHLVIYLTDRLRVSIYISRFSHSCSFSVGFS